MVLRGAGYNCEHCSRPAVDPAHGIGRKHLAVAWDWSNVFALCRECHDYFHHYPDRWREWRIQRVGLSEIERVDRIAREVTHLATFEITDVWLSLCHTQAQNGSVRARGLVGTESCKAAAFVDRMTERMSA
jgi:hypothetical protein